jgi:hypothetical protein
VQGQEDGKVSKEWEQREKAIPENWHVMIMLCVNSHSKASGTPVPEALDSADAEVIPVPVPIPLIVGIGKDRIAPLEKDLRSESAKRGLLRTVRALVLDRYHGADNVPTLHAVQDLHVTAKSAVAALEGMEGVKTRLRGNTLFEKKAAHETEAFEAVKELAVERAGLQAAMAHSQLSDFHDEVVKRRRVLRKLEHITADGLLTVKGKAAAEVRAPPQRRQAQHSSFSWSCFPDVSPNKREHVWTFHLCAGNACAIAPLVFGNLEISARCLASSPEKAKFRDERMQHLGNIV